MSSYQKHLLALQEELRSMREVEDEPKAEDIETGPRPVPAAPVPSKYAELERIKQEARARVKKEVAESGSAEVVIEQFKKFISQRAKRNKFISTLSTKDQSGMGHVTIVTVLNTFKNMGFRLMFDQVKALLTSLRVYDEQRDRVFYRKIISAVFRKLYRKGSYAPPPPPDRLAAISSIQMAIRNRLARKRMNVRPKPDFKQLMQAFIIKAKEKPLMDAFQKIDRDKSGFIDVEELEHLFLSYGLTCKSDQVAEFFKFIDKKERGKIDLEDLNAIIEENAESAFAVIDALAVYKDEIDVNKLIEDVQTAINETDYTLERIFAIFDTEFKGSINFEAFYNVIHRIAPRQSLQDVKHLFAHIDEDKSGEITYKEFSQVFFKKAIEQPVDILRRSISPSKRRQASETKVSELKPTLIEEIQRVKKLKEEEFKIKERQDLEYKMDPVQKVIDENRAKKRQAEEYKKSNSFMTGIIKKPLPAKQMPERSWTTVSQKKRAPSPMPKPRTEKRVERKLTAYQKQLEQFIRSEYVLPLVSSVVTLCEERASLRLSKLEFERRPVIKHHFVSRKDWEKPVTNPLPRSLWMVPKIGRAGYLDTEGQLFQYDLSSGQDIIPLQLGIRPPLQRVPVLGLACDTYNARLFTLNKQWYLEAWDLVQQSALPLHRVKVLSPIIGEDYIQLYQDRIDELFPKILYISANQKLLINATAVDGYIYIYDAISVSMNARLRFSLAELSFPKPILEALGKLSGMFQDCVRMGISESRVFELLDRSGDGFLSYDELRLGIRQLKVNITEEEIRGVFQVMDTERTGLVRQIEFWKTLEVIQKSATQEKFTLELPAWVSDINANQRARELLSRLFRALEERSYTPMAMFSIFDQNNSGFITRTEFRRTLEKLLYPLITERDIDLLEQLADRNNSGSINYEEFSQFLSMKQENSHKSGPLSNLQFVIHRCLELGIDLYKNCTLLDPVGLGTLQKATFLALILNLPLGLKVPELRTIENDLVFDSAGNIDYLGLFANEEYLDLLSRYQKPGVVFEIPVVQEKPAMIEDFVMIDDLNLIAYSCRDPLTSTIFCKDLAGRMLCKLVGHWNSYPPVLEYVPTANALISGERRIILKENTEISTCKMPPCELLIWNMQKDLIDKFQMNPPWVLRPYRKVHAHEISILDIKYLSQAQCIVTSGADDYIKIWDPIGTPYRLSQDGDMTVCNKFMSLVGEEKMHDKLCYKMEASNYKLNEWLTCICVSENSGKKIMGTISSWNLTRVNLQVPAHHIDRKIPLKIESEAAELCSNKRIRNMNEFRAIMADQLRTVIQQSKFTANINRNLRKAIIRACLFGKEFDKVITAMLSLPTRKRFRREKVSVEEVYGLMVEAGLLHNCAFPEFAKLFEKVDKQTKLNPQLPQKSYSHPGLAKLGHMVKQNTVDLKRLLEQHEIDKSGKISRSSFKIELIEILKLEEGSIEGMLDELDPIYSNKIDKAHVLSIFDADIFASKILKLAKPSEVISELQKLIFPDFGLKLQYALVDSDDSGSDLITLDGFIRAFKRCQIPIEPQVLASTYDVLKDSSGRLRISVFINEVYSGALAQQMNEVNLVLTELKCRLLHLRISLRSFFGEDSDFITIDEFISKSKKLRVNATETNLQKAGLFLAVPTQRTAGISLDHFQRYLHRLPSTIKYTAPALPAKDLLIEFISSRLLKNDKMLKDNLKESAVSQYSIDPPKVRGMLEKFYNIPASSGIADIIVTEIMQTSTMQIESFVARLKEFVALETPPSAGASLHFQVREAVESYSVLKDVEFSALVLQIFSAWEESSSEDLVDVHDFVNTLRFNIPNIREDLLANLLLIGPLVAYKNFAAEAFPTVEAIRTKTMTKATLDKMKEAVNEALKHVCQVLQSSHLSLARAFELFDKDGSQTIDTSEFAKVLEVLDIKLSRELTQSLIDEFDKDRNGSISYTEFIGAVLSQGSPQTTDTLKTWRQISSKYNKRLLSKFASISAEFRLRALSQEPNTQYLTYRQIVKLLETFSIFTVGEIESLADFGAEGSAKESTENLLPSQMGRSFASSKTSQTVNFISMADAASSLFESEHKVKSQKEKQSNTEHSQIDSAAQLTSFILKERAKEEEKASQREIEKDLFGYLAQKMNDNNISLEKMFAEIDTDQSGLISKSEFGEFMSKLGYVLTEDELDSILIAVDTNRDGEVSYKELRDKLKIFGYQEPWKLEKYIHEWEDFGLTHFFKKFFAQKDWATYQDLFAYFDYNHDGELTSQEVYRALAAIDRPLAEKMLNIVMITSRHVMYVEDLARALEYLEREIPKKAHVAPLTESLEEAMKQLNSFQSLNALCSKLELSVFSLHKLVFQGRKRRGADLYSLVFKTEEAKRMVQTALLKQKELLEYVSSRSIDRILHSAFTDLIFSEMNVLPNANLVNESGRIPRFESSSFKVLPETARQPNHAYKEIDAVSLPQQEDLQIVVYTPEGLKHASEDGNLFDFHLNKQLDFHIYFQETNKNVGVLLGKHEKRVGVDPSDKEVFAIYARPDAVSLAEYIQIYGGLFKIPVFYRTRASLYLAKYFACQLLDLIHALHSCSSVLRYAALDSFYISSDGSRLILQNFKALGIFDSTGTIISAPDISICKEHSEDMMNDPFLPPEFLLERSQTAMADVWIFGAVMFTVLFGRPPPSFLQAYYAYHSHKQREVSDFTVKPSSSFLYDIYKGLSIDKGKANDTQQNPLRSVQALLMMNSSNRLLQSGNITYQSTGALDAHRSQPDYFNSGKLPTEALKQAKYHEDQQSSICLIKSIRSGSFSGMIDSEIQAAYQELLSEAPMPEKNDIGKFLDLIALCLQIDPSKRPTIQALRSSPVMKLDSYQQIQAEKFAPALFQYRSPEIAVTLNITAELLKLCHNFSLENTDAVLGLIHYAFELLCNKGDFFKTRDVSKLAQNPMMAAANSELVRQAVEDNIFDMFVMLSLRSFKLGEPSVLKAFLQLLTEIMYEMASYTTPCSPYVSTFIECLLKLFVGEEHSLASHSLQKNYMSRGHAWTPELFSLVGPLYKDTISENGQGQHYYPVIKDFIGSDRHFDYFSELLMLAENLVALSRDDVPNKRRALRHISSMLQTGNSGKTLAALDFRVPAQILSSLHDPAVRKEGIQILYEVSRGCGQEAIPSLLKTAVGDIDALQQMSLCFEVPIYFPPLVRLLKLPHEPFDTKEFAARTLINALRGSDKTLRAALNPASDALLTLCKSLVASSSTADKLSSRMLGPLMGDLLGNLLDTAPPSLLRAVAALPGSEALLKEQGLSCPPLITLPILMESLPNKVRANTDIGPVACQLKNWLKYVYQPADQHVAFSAVSTVLSRLRECADIFWDIARVVPTADIFVSVSGEDRDYARGQVTRVLDLIEWLVYSDLDFMWVQRNVDWLMDKTNEALESGGNEFEVFPVDLQGLHSLKIVARFLTKKNGEEVMSDFDWGRVFARQLEFLLYRLQDVIVRNTPGKDVLWLAKRQQEAIVPSFKIMIGLPKLLAQFLETEFTDKLVGEFLTDMKVLEGQVPIRAAAIELIQISLVSKVQNLYEDLIMHFTRYKTVEGEVINLQSTDPAIRRTACDLFSVFIAIEDTTIEFLLLEHQVYSVVYRAFEVHPELKQSYQPLFQYSLKFI